MKMLRQLQFSVLIMMSVLLSACRQKPKDGLTDTYTSGVIAIAADESFRPIVQEEIDVFEGLFPLAGIVPRYVTEVEAVNLLLKDSLRLAITSRRLTPEEKKSFNSRKFFPQEIKIATDGLALITNRNNPDTLISVKQLRGILTGETGRWKELYPASRLGDIRLVFDNKNSGTVRFAVDSIVKGAPLSKRVKALKTNREVIDYVSRTPDAMGIIGVNWLSDRNDTTRLSFSKEVRVMSVSAAGKATPANSYKPYQAYLFYGNYPLVRSIYVLLNDPRSALPWGFASFLASDRGQRIILKSGLLPATQPVRVVDVKDE
ncbi:PstS family phosphate ABC transporter substrate-binding protein [uncultured Bacteroides sp.]|uniref:PstS family phosphate ABC transporter substrate-binding protein n=1 Tax=uncultured Bacteroides sp. TaxID=162156 RepID=UPI0025E042D2|nr:substrate-binding domain-containing protein [uncultured Bacteroides sp.]